MNSYGVLRCLWKIFLQMCLLTELQKQQGEVNREVFRKARVPGDELPPARNSGMGAGVRDEGVWKF